MLKREKVSRTLLHKIIVAVGVFFLFWPAITTNLFSAGLMGDVPKTPPPKLSLQDWFDFSFQDAADHWWLERFGLRGLFVRLNNQINYKIRNR